MKASRSLGRLLLLLFPVWRYGPGHVDRRLGAMEPRSRRSPPPQEGIFRCRLLVLSSNGRCCAYATGRRPTVIISLAVPPPGKGRAINTIELRRAIVPREGGTSRDVTSSNQLRQGEAARRRGRKATGNETTPVTDFHVSFTQPGTLDW